MLVAVCVSTSLLLTGTPAVACPPDYRATRLAGSDRIETAIAVSRAAWTASQPAKSAVLARADDFADALAGAPLAVHRFGPLLLTGSSGLDERVLAELQRAVEPGATVYLLGGSMALSPDVEAAVTAAGFRAQRVAGNDRYGTAVAVAEADGGPTTVFLATGRNFPDAIVAGAIAGQLYGSVLFTDDRAVPAATAAYLDRATTTYAFGDQAADAYPDAIPVRGDTRYDTAVVAARLFFGKSGEPRQMGIATGANFPDALAGSAFVGRPGGGPLLLTFHEQLPAVTSGYISDHAVPAEAIYIYGDRGVVSQAVEDAIERMMYSACGV